MAKGASPRLFETRNQGPALWLLLLSILAHAFVPPASPVQRAAAGSAFSVSTAEVSLAPRRAGLSAKRHLQEDNDWASAGGDADDGSFAAEPLVPASFEALAPFTPAESWPASGGAAPFSARAPPAA